MASIQLLKRGFVGPGESKTHEYLSKHLPQSWTGVALKEVVSNADYVREADFILVGDRSILVLEEKSWTGRLHCNENWWRVGSTVRHSPVNQASEVARILAMRLKEKFPSFSSHWISDPFVILSADNVELRMSQDEKRSDRVLLLKDAPDALQQFDRTRRSPFFAVDRNTVSEFLGFLPPRRMPASINVYQLEESLAPTGVFRNWRAVHSLLGEDRILRVASISNRKGPDGAVESINAIIREAVVSKQKLSVLVTSGRVPQIEDPFEWNDEFIIVPVHVPEGRTLIADREARCPNADVVISVFHDAFGLLSRIHDAGVIHRNLAPSRIFIGDKEEVRFGDFLVARVEGTKTVAATAWECDPETPFTAPEIREDASNATPTSDVYGLSASLLFWITGKVLEPGDDVGEALLESPLQSSEIRELIAAELQKCISPFPEDRPHALSVHNAFR